jgi:hypothetical protein
VLELVSLSFYFTGHEGRPPRDQHPVPNGHHDGDGPLGSTSVETNERPDEKCCSSDESPKPRH